MAPVSYQLLLSTTTEPSKTPKTPQFYHRQINQGSALFCYAFKQILFLQLSNICNVGRLWIIYKLYSIRVIYKQNSTRISYKWIECKIDKLFQINGVNVLPYGFKLQFYQFDYQHFITNLS